MNEKVKTICLVIITLSVLASAIAFVWDVVEKQAYFEKESKKLENIWIR